MEKNASVRGIGGWLALLIVNLAILSPTIGFGNFQNEINDLLEIHPELKNTPRWESWKLGATFIISTSCLLSFLAGLGLWIIHHPNSVRFAIFVLWVLGAFARIAYILWLQRFLPPQLSQNLFIDSIGSIVGSCIGAGIWTVYLMLSVRVKNTYYSASH